MTAATHDSEGADRAGPGRLDEAPRRLPGLEARFVAEPNEIFVELCAGRPSYVRLREGDAEYRERTGESTPLQSWTVTDVTPERVRADGEDGGESREWSRTGVERGLAVGTYSTGLTDFERVSTLEVGGRGDDEPYVTVIAYGDNGLKYGRGYRFDDRVRAALEDDGYTVR